jgi:hypothetical protein
MTFKQNRFRRFIFVIGGTIAILTFIFIAIGFIKESKDIWKEGVGLFFVDLAFRIIVGLIVSIYSGLPYFLGSLAIKRSGKPLFLLICCIIVFAIDMYIRIKIMFFSSSSTEGVFLLISPVLLSLPVILLWILIPGVKIDEK